MMTTTLFLALSLASYSTPARQSISARTPGTIVAQAGAPSGASAAGTGSASTGTSSAGDWIQWNRHRIHWFSGHPQPRQWIGRHGGRPVDRHWKHQVPDEEFAAHRLQQS